MGDGPVLEVRPSGAPGPVAPGRELHGGRAHRRARPQQQAREAELRRSRQAPVRGRGERGRRGVRAVQHGHPVHHLVPSAGVPHQAGGALAVRDRHRGAQASRLRDQERDPRPKQRHAGHQRESTRRHEREVRRSAGPPRLVEGAVRSDGQGLGRIAPRGAHQPADRGPQEAVRGDRAPAQPNGRAVQGGLAAAAAASGRAGPREGAPDDRGRNDRAAGPRRGESRLRQDSRRGRAPGRPSRLPKGRGPARGTRRHRVRRAQGRDRDEAQDPHRPPDPPERYETTQALKDTPASNMRVVDHAEVPRAGRSSRISHSIFFSR